MKTLVFINDVYKADSISNMVKQKQETVSTKFNITGFEQHMPQGNDW